MSFGFYRASPMRDHGADWSAKHARDEARSARSELGEVRHDVERLLMITEALWEFLKTEHGYADDDLIKKIAEIDARDGKLDGRVSEVEAPKACPACGRVLSRKRPFCLYCGEAVVVEPFER